MDRLNFKQRVWVKELLLSYFPGISSDYPDEVFGIHLRFSEDGPFILPAHLQYPDEPDAPKELEINIPVLLGQEPFLSLINRNYLDEIKNEAEKRIFNIFKYLARKEFEATILKEEALFSVQFINKFKLTEEKYQSKYNKKEVPDLFLKNTVDNNNICEYNPQTNSFIIDYNKMVMHAPGNNSVVAYQRFARKIYCFRVIGILINSEATDYKTLNKMLLDHLRKEIKFIDHLGNEIKFVDELFKTNNDYFKSFRYRLGKEMFERDEYKSILRLSLTEVINYLFEGQEEKSEEKKKEKNKKSKREKIDIHIPPKPEDLWVKIKKRCTQMFLKRWYVSRYLSSYTTGQQTKIRKWFKEFVALVDMLSLSSESQQRLEDAGEHEGYYYYKVKAMYKAVSESINLDFLGASKIFPKDFKHQLSVLYWPKPISIYTQVSNFAEEGNKMFIVDFFNSGFDINAELGKKMDMEIIRARLEKQNTEDSVNAYIEYIKMLIDLNDFDMYDLIQKIKKKEKDSYDIGKFWIHYLKLSGREDSRDDERDFNRKIREFFANIALNRRKPNDKHNSKTKKRRTAPRSFT